MKKFSLLLSSAVLSLSMVAQDMPQPSPNASVMQRVGLTDVTVAYSRPAVNKRVIFGDLVPYNELWRTGANKITTITLSTDAKLAGQDLKAGTYSMLTVPEADQWTVIFNKNTEMWGTGGYKQSDDAMRVRVPVGQGTFTERFTISIENMTDNSADLIFAWSTTKVVVPITVETEKMVEASMSKGLMDASRACRSAAEASMKKKDYDKALMYIDQSIALNDYWYTNWIKAQILAGKGDKKAAKAQGEKAIKMGEEVFAARNEPFTYKDGLVKEMSAW
jgi:tetratricopeptide (TPR) repeat protein